LPGFLEPLRTRRSSAHFFRKLFYDRFARSREDRSMIVQSLFRSTEQPRNKSSEIMGHCDGLAVRPRAELRGGVSARPTFKHAPCLNVFRPKTGLSADFPPPAPARRGIGLLDRGIQGCPGMGHAPNRAYKRSWREIFRQARAKTGLNGLNM